MISNLPVVSNLQYDDHAPYTEVDDKGMTECNKTTEQRTSAPLLSNNVTISDKPCSQAT